jgi:hypothetical protein
MNSLSDRHRRSPTFLLFWVGTLLLPTLHAAEQSVDVASSREAMVGKTRVVLISAGRVMAFSGEADPKKAVVPCLCVTYLMEWPEDEKVKVARPGRMDVILSGTATKVEPIQVGSRDLQRASDYERYNSSTGLKLPAVQSAEKAIIVDRFIEGIEIKGKKIDLKLKDLGFNENKGDCVFKNIPLE